MTYQTKIFRGTCADVTREMNEWFSANEIVISHVLQTEQSINVLTVTVIYHLRPKDNLPRVLQPKRNKETLSPRR